MAPLQDGSPGLKGYELLNWFGLFSTGGTPADVVDKLNAVTLEALAEPKTREDAGRSGPSLRARPRLPNSRVSSENESRKFGESSRRPRSSSRTRPAHSRRTPQSLREARLYDFAVAAREQLTRRRAVEDGRASA